MQEEVVIQKAEFNPAVKNYWVLGPSIVLACTVVCLPLLLIWLPIGFLLCSRYLKSLECVLTNKAVKLKSGILIRQEKTIPLDKITDMGLVQGPIMRAMDLERLTVETAGSSAPGALASVIGVVNAREFRDAVMNQKEKLSEAHPPSDPARSTAAAIGANPDGSSAESLELLREIRDSLRRIEKRSDV